MENETPDRSGLLSYPGISFSASAQGFYASTVASVANHAFSASFNTWTLLRPCPSKESVLALDGALRHLLTR